ncbi:hypothetical protein LRAMOSA09619 [Lichtheimia ramosa]|uniref:C2H2-type domain-containing protein n=1 Tax=Lichtheimia ramosa TaxID=688394 RepID=A0A077WH64_9FUNG|nr:hypothetical protein LRAMOSA09619 [Lichtheimia ramosa]
MMSSPHQQPEQQHQQQPNTSTPFIDPSSVMVAAAYSAAGLPPLSHLLLPDQQQPLEPPTPQHTPAPMSSCAFYYPSPPQEPENNKAYSFVPGATQKKRPRRKYHEIERLYPCSYPGCTKSYGTLNHLNAHVAMQKHGPKRLPAEFKEMRKQWRKQKREQKAAQQHQQQQQQQQLQQVVANTIVSSSESGGGNQGIVAVSDVSAAAAAAAFLVPQTSFLPSWQQQQTLMVGPTHEMLHPF